VEVRQLPRLIRQFLPTAVRGSSYLAAAAAALVLANCADATVEPSAAGPAPAGPSLAAAAAQQQDDVAPGEVLVQFADGVDGDEVLRARGLARKASGYQGRFHVAQAARGQERAAAASLQADPRVLWAEPNYIRHVDAIDSRLWAFYNPGGLNMSFYNDPNGRTGPLPGSYASTTDADEDAIEGIAAGGGAVVISSLDTGVDFNHPEFTGRLIAGCDWYSQAAAGKSGSTCTDFTPYDTPDEGHGTHTTGTAAGTNVGVAGITGAGPNVKILVQRVCGTAGCYTSSIVNAIYAAADYPGMVAMNLSLGGNSESTAEKNAINYAVNTKGVLVIAAAGNSGSGKVGCPACDPNAISVSATNWQDGLAGYSQSGSGLDISAPGGYCYSNTTEEGCIFSAIVSGYTEGRTYSGPTGGSYAYMQGTSMATPQVTGAAAAVASKLGLRGSALRSRLLSTADDRGAAGYDTKFGNGRLNVYRAVTGSTLASPQ
jgi:subtilisin family serine protease